MRHLVTFRGYIRRPECLAGGLRAQLYAGNGDDADAVTVTGRSEYLGALVQVDLVDAETREELGSFSGDLERPKNETLGVFLRVFGENGPAADNIVGLAMTAFLDRPVEVTVSILRDANGAPEAPAQKGPHGPAMATLHKSAFLVERAVLEALGTDNEYQDWCRRLPSALSGRFSEYVDGEGRCVYAHWRTVKRGSGTAVKPPYSGLPLTQEEHLAEADHHARLGREKWDAMVESYLRRWAWERLRLHFGTETMTTVDPVSVLAFFSERGVDHLLPPAFRAFV